MAAGAMAKAKELEAKYGQGMSRVNCWLSMPNYGSSRMNYGSSYDSNYGSDYD